LLHAIKRYGGLHPRLEPLYEEAIRDTIEQFEATGSPVITDGEQRKYHNFATYCVEGLPNTATDGFELPFADGHSRRWRRLTAGPFRYVMHGYDFLDRAMKYAHVPVKQAIISPSALSLMYPTENLPGYSREEFIADLLGEHEREIRGCLAKGAYNVQIDFTEGRLAIKLDPSGWLLNGFIELNNFALSRFSKQECRHIGVHTCPGSDRDSTHSADVDYAELLPRLFELQVGNFYIALAGEPDRIRVLRIIRQCLRPGRRVFIGWFRPSIRESKVPKKYATGPWRQHDIFRSNNSEPRTTAVSHHFAMTLRPRAERRLRRFARVWRERPWPKK
jgi:methionine synthase II (cobalamin-independent)